MRRLNAFKMQNVILEERRPKVARIKWNRTRAWSIARIKVREWVLCSHTCISLFSQAQVCCVVRRIRATGTASSQSKTKKQIDPKLSCPTNKNLRVARSIASVGWLITLLYQFQTEWGGSMNMLTFYGFCEWLFIVGCADEAAILLLPTQDKSKIIIANTSLFLQLLFCANPED